MVSKTREQRIGRVYSLREGLVTKEGLTNRNMTQRKAKSIFKTNTKKKKKEGRMRWHNNKLHLLCIISLTGEPDHKNS